MSPTELMIHDLAQILAELKLHDPIQKRQVIQKTLTSLVKYAISQREVEQLNGIRADMRRVEDIRIASKQAI